MEKQEFKSKWDELARELGAEISPETQQREVAVSTAGKDTGSAASVPAAEKPAKERAPLPKRAAVDWNNLAGELGLPPAPPESAAPAEAPREVREEEVHREPPLREPPRREPPRREPPRREPPRREVPQREASQERRPERPGRERKERGERGERSGNRRDQREGRGHRDKRRETRDFDAGPVDESEAESVQKVERAERRPEPSAPAEEPAKPASMSLWHKIFGSPAEQTAKIVDDVSGVDATEPSDARDEPRAAGSGFADAHADVMTPTEHGGEFDNEDGPTMIVEDGAPSDRKGGRPRRRRGRGRGRRSEGQAVERRPAEHRDDERPRSVDRGDIEDEFTDEELDAPDDADDADDALGDLEDSDIDDANAATTGAGAPRSRSALSRTIPSWDEAIGFIVDSNMQSRSQRRPPSRPGSRDNSSRGRSRGRRKN